MHLQKERKMMYLLRVFGLHETLWIKDRDASIATRPIPFWFLSKVMAKEKRKRQ